MHDGNGKAWDSTELPEHYIQGPQPCSGQVEYETGAS